MMLIAALVVTFSAPYDMAAFAMSGQASYYANKFNGRKTASGQIFSNSKLTAAHRSLPFGTRITVTNKKNGKSVVVTINDRGPFARGRVLDLSKAAASQIGMVRSGHAPVEFHVVGKKKAKEVKRRKTLLDLFS